MNDDEIEGLLRGMRPAGPPPHLRARIVAPRPARAWPWMAAAAALFAVTTILQLSAGDVLRDASSAIAAAQHDDSAEIDVLREAYGSDQAAFQAAVLRRELDALVPTAPQQDARPQ